MVRSLNQWAKTLSFPARISPNRTKECNVNVHPITPSMLQAPPTPPRKHQNDQASSPSASPQNVPITEISQIVSLRWHHIMYENIVKLRNWTQFIRKLRNCVRSINCQPTVNLRARQLSLTAVRFHVLCSNQLRSLIFLREA